MHIAHIKIHSWQITFIRKSQIKHDIQIDLISCTKVKKKKKQQQTKWKTKRYHTVGTVPKSNRKIIKRGKKYNTYYSYKGEQGEIVSLSLWKDACPTSCSL